MNTVTISIPESLRKEAEALAERDGISLDQFLTIAAAEKISALRAVDYLKGEAANGSPEDWEYVLSRVPARPPLAGDEKLD